MTTPDTRMHILMDAELMRLLTLQSPFQKWSWCYRSNWRVLHVDGIEGMVYARLPIPRGEKRNFFTYAEQPV
jgi:hypothetical protein